MVHTFSITVASMVGLILHIATGLKKFYATGRCRFAVTQTVPKNSKFCQICGFSSHEGNMMHRSRSDIAWKSIPYV